MSLITEFDLISRYFAQNRPKRKDVLLGIGDDAALLKVPDNQVLVVSSDSVVSGVHFPETTKPNAVGYKSLAVSLSDLAAMGAEPAWVLLNLTLVEAEETWLREFSEGFFTLVKKYGLELVGGDTTQGPITHINTQVMGFVPPNEALCRSTAKVGDLIYVTGKLGKAGLALQLLKNNQPVSDDLLHALNYPNPRVEIGMQLRKLASAAIDISDGLAADLNHILKQSRVGASIFVENLPIAKELDQFSAQEAYALALSAGDDYELCFTIPANREPLLKNIMNEACELTYVGKIESEEGLRITYNDGKSFHLDKKGWVHFK